MTFVKSLSRLCRALLFVAACVLAALMAGCSHPDANDGQERSVEPVASESAVFIRLSGIADSQKVIQPAVLSFHGEGGSLIESGIEIPADGSELEAPIDLENSSFLRVVSSPVFMDGSYYKFGENASFGFWVDRTSDGWELSKNVVAPEGVEVVSMSGMPYVTIDFTNQEKAILSVAALDEMIEKSLTSSEAVVADLQRISKKDVLDDIDAQMLERNKLKVSAFTVLRDRLSSMADGDIEALAKCYKDYSAVNWAITAEEVPSFSE